MHQPLLLYLTDTSLLISVLPTNHGYLEVHEIYASGGSEAHIPCSFQPGMLQACYFGEWYKNTTRIFSISQPSNVDMICGSVSPGRQITNMSTRKYWVNEETFELIISSVNARDDTGPYQCRLFVLNPASSNGQTSRFRSMPVNLTIDGKINYPVKLLGHRSKIHTSPECTSWICNNWTVV